MLKVVAHIIALPDHINEVKSILLALIEPTRQEVGCLEYELYQNRHDPTDFTFVEKWTDETALNNHLKNHHIQNALSQVEGLLASPPDIRRFDKLA